MLSIAACVAHPDPKYGLDSTKLFHMAERALHHCRMENRIDIIQALVLLSLRQTGCGDKNLAFTYAGRACCMALSMGLNLAPAQPESPVEAETRSRVYVSYDDVNAPADQAVELLHSGQDIGRGDGALDCASVSPKLDAPAVDD